MAPIQVVNLDRAVIFFDFLQQRTVRPKLNFCLVAIAIRCKNLIWPVFAIVTKVAEIALRSTPLPRGSRTRFRLELEYWRNLYSFTLVVDVTLLSPVLIGSNLVSSAVNNFCIYPISKTVHEYTWQARKTRHYYGRHILGNSLTASASLGKAAKTTRYFPLNFADTFVSVTNVGTNGIWTLGYVRV